MSMETERTPQEEFEELASYMALIAQNARSAPEADRAAHETALLACYGLAYALVEKHPDIAPEAEDSDDNAFSLHEKLTSKKQLEEYRERGLLEDTAEQHIDTELLETVQKAMATQAFSELFASAVVIEDTEPDFEDDDDDFEEDEESEQFDPNDINALDVIEMIEEHTFTDLQKSLITYALKTRSFSLKEIRKTEPDFVTLPKADFEALVKGFRSFAGEVVGFLKTAGIPARLETLQKPRGYYRLHIGKDAETEDDKQAGLKELFGDNFEVFTGRSARPRRKASEITDRAPAPEPLTFEKERPAILSLVQARIARSESAPKLTVIAKQVVEELKNEHITHAVVCGIIKDFVSDDELHYGRSNKGSRTLSLVKVENRKRKDQGSEKNGREEPLTAEDLPLVNDILNALLAQRHQNKGLTLKSMALALDMDQDDVTSCLTKLVREGIITRKQAYLRSRSPHSNKSKVLFYKFASQEAWNQYKEDQGAFVHALVAK